MKCSGTKQRILEAAAHQIYLRGYGATTIDDILEESGVKKGNLYYYFGSKEELGLAVLDYFHESHLSALRHILQDKTKSPRERLEIMLDATIAKVAGQACCSGCPFGNLALEMSDANESFRLRLAKHFADWQDLIAETVRAGQMLGEINPELRPDNYACYLITMVEGAIMMAKVTKEVRPLEHAFADARARLAIPQAA